MDSNLRTLYIKNLPSRPKNISHLKQLLLNAISPNDPSNINQVTQPIDKPSNIKPIESTYNIISISIYRTKKLRNQAFISFFDHLSAINFINHFDDNNGNGLKLNGHKLLIEFSKKDSLLALALRKTVNESNDDNLKVNVQCPLNKALLTRRNNKNQEYIDKKQLNRKCRRLRQRLRSKNEQISESSLLAATASFKKKLLLKKKIPTTTVNNKADNKSVIDKKKQKPLKRKGELEIPPNKMLLVQNLPTNVTIAHLENIFKIDGFKNIKYLAIRNLAFIEYEDIESATKILDDYSNLYNWNGNLININYAR
ncbi:hypothetical protein TBLA_0C02170 [Henningerozyma blattae CBS 6284]|uniref:RRM domain-containing protein n=1 Tax=Henningerozyma blattae (strain ATCC 34711 / CBS 6284 / DSM 70876 / NBRC 10599 / NRRL Y-10934 / UCD 77-7) TaxID=1071380 RepID=I2H0X7_HENB6|nr:hypothetical protein TBLA_0C02170 [Tetrapisispora blattae CBS 6284]CCH60029.1 hypothetical protein TBLA_0C02170 [Tetrapisispora blattae CBS 6284]